MIHARSDYARFQDPALTYPSLLGEGSTPIAEDEPVLLFRAKDKHFLKVMSIYRDFLLFDEEMSDIDRDRMVGSIDVHSQRAMAWRSVHGTKAPDMPVHDRTKSPPTTACQYAVVEIMGHRRYVGAVSEVVRFGGPLLRIQTLSLPELPEERHDGENSDWEEDEVAPAGTDEDEDAGGDADGGDENVEPFPPGRLVTRAGAWIKDALPAVESETFEFGHGAIFSIHYVSYDEAQADAARNRLHRARTSRFEPNPCDEIDSSAPTPSAAEVTR